MVLTSPIRLQVSFKNLTGIKKNKFSNFTKITLLLTPKTADTGLSYHKEETGSTTLLIFPGMQQDKDHHFHLPSCSHRWGWTRNKCQQRKQLQPTQFNQDAGEVVCARWRACEYKSPWSNRESSGF